MSGYVCQRCWFAKIRQFFDSGAWFIIATEGLFCKLQSAVRSLSDLVRALRPVSTPDNATSPPFFTCIQTSFGDHPKCYHMWTGVKRSELEANDPSVSISHVSSLTQIYPHVLYFSHNVVLRHRGISPYSLIFVTLAYQSAESVPRSWVRTPNPLHFEKERLPIRPVREVAMVTWLYIEDIDLICCRYGPTVVLRIIDTVCADSQWTPDLCTHTVQQVSLLLCIIRSGEEVGERFYSLPRDWLSLLGCSVAFLSARKNTHKPLKRPRLLNSISFQVHHSQSNSHSNLHTLCRWDSAVRKRIDLKMLIIICLKIVPLRVAVYFLIIGC